MSFRAARLGGCLFVVSALSASGITLDSALARALGNNPAIQQAKFQVEQAMGERVTLRSTAFPDVRIGGVAGAQGGHRAGQSSFQPFAFGRGGIVQPLFKASIPASWRKGDVNVLIAQQRLNIAVTEQMHAARVAYYSAVYNRSLQTMRVAQQSQLSANSAGQRNRYQAGDIQHSFVKSATMLEEEIGPKVEEARRGYEGAVLQINEITGEPLSANAELIAPGAAVDAPAMSTDVASATEATIRHRPDLQLARLLVRAATEDQRLIEAGYYPEVDAVVSGDYIPVSGIRRGSEGSPRRSDDIVSSEVRGGATYSWRVVDNGQVGGAVLRARSIREINELTCKKLEANVGPELARIHNNLAAIAARRRAYESGIIAAEATVAAVRQSFAEGLSSELEFRSATTSLLELRSKLAAATLDQNVSAAEWDRATGAYLDFSAETSARAR